MYKDSKTEHFFYGPGTGYINNFFYSFHLLYSKLSKLYFFCHCHLQYWLQQSTLKDIYRINYNKNTVNVEIVFESVFCKLSKIQD